MSGIFRGGRRLYYLPHASAVMGHGSPQPNSSKLEPLFSPNGPLAPSLAPLLMRPVKAQRGVSPAWTTALRLPGWGLRIESVAFCRGWSQAPQHYIACLPPIEAPELALADDAAKRGNPRRSEVSSNSDWRCEALVIYRLCFPSLRVSFGEDWLDPLHPPKYCPVRKVRR